jgi:DNA-binding MarR family transcriptional regulator
MIPWVLAGSQIGPPQTKAPWWGAERRARRVLERRGAMNAIFFSAKRVFHGAVRVTRKSLLSVKPGLTAARFDMLFALTERTHSRDKLGRRNCLQSGLRAILGVSAPVVSRMVRSLEALGWLTRTRSLGRDRRQILVSLTEAGLGCIRQAFELLFRAAERIVYRAICFGRHRDDCIRLQRMDMLESLLGELRDYCGDTATLYYAWGHPDD